MLVKRFDVGHVTLICNQMNGISLSLGCGAKCSLFSSFRPVGGVGGARLWNMKHELCGMCVGEYVRTSWLINAVNTRRHYAANARQRLLTLVSRSSRLPFFGQFLIFFIVYKFIRVDWLNSDVFNDLQVYSLIFLLIWSFLSILIDLILIFLDYLESLLDLIDLILIFSNYLLNWFDHFFRF